MVDFKDACRQSQCQTAEINAAERQGKNSQRNPKRSRGAKNNDERNDKNAINHAFGHRPEDFAERERFGIDRRGENRVVSRLVNHSEIRPVSHFKNRPHQNRESQDAGADKRQVSSAAHLRCNQRPDAETEREECKNRLDYRSN